MFSAKSASLLAGIFQQSSLVLIIQYSKTQYHKNNGHHRVGYLTSIAVAASEIFKLCLSYILEVKRSQSSNNEATSFVVGSASGTLSVRTNRKGYIITLIRMLSVNNRESAKLIVPAILYLVQNNLLFLALSNLSVPLYQVTNQGKLLTTALISRVLLRKKINGLQYFSITLLGLGVAVIHLSEYYASSAADTSTATKSLQEGQNQAVGLCAVLISCCTSGFAGVYFELILKTSKAKQSIHVKNFQLAFWSFLFAAIHITYSDSSKIQENGLFQGFDWLVIIVIVAQGMTGFVVSLMLKYADAVLKGFAIAIAALVSTIGSIVLFGTKVDASFILGASMVMLAAKLYSSKNEIKTLSTNKKENRSRNMCSCCNPQMASGGMLGEHADSANEEVTSTIATILDQISLIPRDKVGVDEEGQDRVEGDRQDKINRIT